ncbi:MAG: hypothetical protein ACOH2H_13310 [Cypionkella sp.]
MRQILLATALILAPVGAFTAFNVYFVGAAQADASLGDLTPLKTIIADVQKIAAGGDLAGASARMTDWETSWDASAAGMRALNPTAWGKIDDASDAALKAVRAGRPDAAAVTTTLADLMAAIENPAGQ